MSRRRRGGDDPVPIGESLAEVGAELGLPAPAVAGSLAERWAEVVGDDLATHTSPGAVREGVLRVTVDDAMRATQLRYLAGDLLDRIDAVVGSGVVTRVHVVVVPRTS